MKWFCTLAVRTVVTASALLSLAGCGGTGDVSGKVYHNGEPLPGGLVTIFDSQEGHNQSMIQKDGSYTVANVATGPAVVCVETSPPQPSVVNKNNPPTLQFGPYKAIPLKYKDKKGGIPYEVKRGKQEFDIKLEGEAENK